VFLVFNRQIFLLVNGPNTPYLDWPMLSLTHLGNGMAAAMIVLLLTPIRRDLTIRAALAMIVAGILTSILKDLFASPRPPAVFGEMVHVLGPKLMRNSLPSGHTSTVFALAFSLRGHTHVRIFRVVMILAALVGISRVYIGAHFPVDVIIGALLGWLCAAGTSRYAGRLIEHLKGPHPVLDTGFLVLAALCGVYLAIFEPMVRYNSLFLRPFGFAGTAAAMFLITKNLVPSRERQ
jgi:membrane-associated phospholipid phosphatase